MKRPKTFGMAAAVIAAVFSGCVCDKCVETPESPPPPDEAETATQVEAGETEDAEAAAETAGETEAGAEAAVGEAEAIAASILEWIAPYQVDSGFRMEREENGDIWLRGTSGDYPSIFSRFYVSVHLDVETREAMCYAYLPTYAPDEKRAEMVEFLMRANCEYGLSPATLILEDDNKIRCQSWVPFSFFGKEPELAPVRLVGSALEKLYAVSALAAQVETGAVGAEAASCARPVGMFPNGSPGDAASARKDTMAVLEKCFPEEDYSRNDIDDDWRKALFAEGDAGSVDFIEASLSGIQEFFDGPFDTLDYTLAVKNGFVWTICPLPVDIHQEDLPGVAEAAMRLNHGLNYALFCLDHNTGKMWCQYGLPVCSLEGEGDAFYGPVPYCVAIKTMAQLSLSKYGAELTAACGNGSGGAEDGSVPAHGEYGPPDDLPALVRMMNANGEWQAARWVKHDGLSMEEVTRRRIDARLYMKYCDDGLTDEERESAWPLDVAELERRLSGMIVRDELSGLYFVDGESRTNDYGTCEVWDPGVNPSIRRLNEECEKWATNVLDKAFGRLSREELVAMLDDGSVTDRTFGWRMNDTEYFVVQRVEEDTAFESRDYLLMTWNGEDEPEIAAAFASIPDSRAIAAVHQAIAGLPAGKNNLAALMFNGVAFRGEATDELARSLLQSASDGGIGIAQENMAILDIQRKREASERFEDDGPAGDDGDDGSKE